ncbi:molecular chaperone [Shewanella algae]|uniref:molecular chaperone n=1 Tax=Shewanella algae TaxID=38313 RepID=UPI0034D78111
MFAGFDYGSANCAIGVMDGGQTRLLPLAEDGNYMPSTIYAMERELISESVLQRLPLAAQADFKPKRAAELSRARTARLELDLLANEQAVFIGNQAIETYMEMPEEGFYVRSPKSFLGASGLLSNQMALFEDIVTLMMQEIHTRAQQSLKQAISQVVIGRPVNFQGIGGEQSNKQAEAILTLGARRAGFTDVAFLYEPMAAALEFESTLTLEQRVLVVDIGGGTSDCSFVRMGPELKDKKDRSDDCLGHSGQRVGGNDLDIALAMAGFMPHLGLGSALITGKPMPRQPFWNAVAVNDVSAQREFSALSSRKLIEELQRDAKEQVKLARLLKVQKDQLGYRLVRSAEQLKIALSDSKQAAMDIGFVEAPKPQPLTVNVDAATFVAAIDESLETVHKLITQALAEGGCQPDVIYLTGGSAKSPYITEQIRARFPDVALVSGDHFGSVVAGLTRWAERLYR